MLTWSYATAIFSEWKDRALRVARDAFAVGGEGDGDAYEMIQPLGLISRPRDPEVDQNGQPKAACGLLVAEDGHEGFAIPTTDPSILEKIPELPKGSTCVYAGNGAFLFLNGETGTVQIIVPYVDSEGNAKSHTLSFDVPGKSVQLRHGGGMAVAMTEGAKNSVVISSKAGDKYVEINDDAIVLNAPTITTNGSQVVGDIPAAQKVLIADEFAAYKAANDANWATLAAAAGSMVPPGLSPTSAIAVLGSAALKASPAP